jgi:hypothetical protein
MPPCDGSKSPSYTQQTPVFPPGGVVSGLSGGRSGFSGRRYGGNILGGPYGSKFMRGDEIGGFTHSETGGVICGRSGFSGRRYGGNILGGPYGSKFMRGDETASEIT